MRFRKMLLITILILGVFLSISVNALAETDDLSNVTLTVAGCKLPEVEHWVNNAQKIAKSWGWNLEVAWYTFDGIVDKMIMDFRNGITSWDILHIDGKDLPVFIRLGLLTPVGDLIKNEELVDEDLDLEDFLFKNIVVSDGKWGPKDTIWAFPNAYAIVALAYRKDIFNDPSEGQAFKNKYGYDLHAPQTYKEFYDVAEFFTRKKGEKLAGEVLDYDFYGTVHSNKSGTFIWHDYVSYAVAFGADVVYNPDTMMPTWNSKENIEAANYYISLIPFMPPSAINMGSGESCAMFCDGKAAMIIEFIDRTITMAEDEKTSKIRNKWDYTTLPSVSEIPNRKSAAIANTTMMGIYSLSKNKEAAFKMLQEVSSKDVMKQLALESAFIPLRESLLIDPDILAKHPSMKNLNKLTTDDVYLFSDPMIPEFGEVQDIIASSLSEAYAGHKSVEDAFDEAQEELIKMFKKWGYIE